jgi:fumarylacetoacetase
MDAVIDAARTSWVPVGEASDFPLQNLPYGVFSSPGSPPRIGVAIGDHVLDLSIVADAGLLDGTIPDPLVVVTADSLLPLLAELLDADDSRIRDSGLAETPTDDTVTGAALVPRGEVTLHLPVRPGDYVDFYSSIQHATNLGRMFRPDSEPLLPNWRHLPVAYHGRASTVVPSGTDIVRPCGQRRGDPDGEEPTAFGPSRRLDIELEVGFVTGGPGNGLGTPVPVADAQEHIYGYLLVNDWSARDIQAWEYQPLGPFLGKSFATSVSCWLVPSEALEPYRVGGPAQEPEPQPYLRADGDHGLDLDLEVWLEAAGGEERRISATNFRDMYWTPPQQLAHVTVNGTAIRPGDLYASGTVSGEGPGTYGSLIELTWGGKEPLSLPDGSTRTFLQDGDTVVLRGWCGGAGRPRVGFGALRGQVAPAPTML